MVKVAVKQPYWFWAGWVVVLAWVGWRVWPVLQVNVNHLGLVAAAMNDETIVQPETVTALTGLQARTLARLFPAKAETWLQAGVTDSSRMLTYLELCLWYWDQGRKEAAVTACREGQGTAIYWMREGITAQIAGDHTQAIALLEMATQVESESAEAWFRLGVLLQLEQRYEEALVAFQAAVTHGYSAHSSLGGIYLQLKRYPEAREVLLNGVTLYPEDRYTYLNLALVAEAEEKWTEADDWYRQLAQLFPDYGPAYSGRGRMALHSGQYAQAVIYFQQATQVEPGRLGFWLELGGAAAQSGDTAIARDAYQQALVLQPDNQQAQTGLQALGQE